MILCSMFCLRLNSVCSYFYEKIISSIIIIIAVNNKYMELFIIVICTNSRIALFPLSVCLLSVVNVLLVVNWLAYRIYLQWYRRFWWCPIHFICEHNCIELTDRTLFDTHSLSECDHNFIMFVTFLPIKTNA